MDNQEQIKILERSFTIVEEIIKNFYIDDEEIFRERVKNEIRNAILENDDPIEYKALLEAQVKIDELSFYEITEMFELFHEDDDWEDEADDHEWTDEDLKDESEFRSGNELPKMFAFNPKMREIILNAEEDGAIPLYDEKNNLFLFRMKLRLAFVDKYYCYMIRFDNFDDVKQGVFYEYIVGKHAIEDKMVLVEDKDLTKKLGALL